MTLTKQEAADLYAWILKLEGYRTFTLARRGNDGGVETDEFMAKHPTARGAYAKLAEGATGEDSPSPVEAALRELLLAGAASCYDKSGRELAARDAALVVLDLELVGPEGFEDEPKLVHREQP